MRVGSSWRTRAIAFTLAAAVVLAGATAAVGRHFTQEAERLTLRLVGVHVGARSGDGFETGQVTAVVVVDVAGSRLLAPLARALVLDVAVASFPIGRAVATPAAGGPTEGPVRFHVEIGTEFASAHALTALTERARAEEPAAIGVSASGTVYLPLGVAQEVSVEGLAPFELTPTLAGEVAAFAATPTAAPGGR